MCSRNLLAHSVIVAVALFGAGAWGHDTGIPYADWMKSLIRPDYPMSYCCGPGDQYYVREYQPSQKHGIAFTALHDVGHRRPHLRPDGQDLRLRHRRRPDRHVHRLAGTERV